MRTCSSCGARNAADGTFCIRCGASLVDLGHDAGAATDAVPVVPERIPDTLVDRAAAQLADGDAAGAVANCRRAVALDPRHVEAYALMGMAFEQLNDPAAALDAYDTTLALAPDRAVERQKASLLRLRLGHTPPPPVRARRAGPGFSCAAIVDGTRQWISNNPPLAAGIGAALLVVIVGSVLLVSVGRAQARAERQARYDNEVLLARQALAGQQYAEATVHFQAAWQIKPGDTVVQSEWEQSYRLSQWAAAEYERQMEIAAGPKYIPNTAGRNPFDPVPIAGTAAVPPPTGQGLPPSLMTTGAAVPPPTVNGGPAYETWQGNVRTPPPPVPSPTTPPSSRRNNSGPGNPIIVPVPSKTPEKPPTPNVDTSGKTGRGEITITVSPRATSRPATTPAADNGGGNDAATWRSRGEQLGREGRTAEAISSLEHAAGAYDDAARRDPSNAAANSQAAETCRARIEILRQNHR